MTTPYVRNAHFITSATAPAGYPDTGLPEIAIAGRSNVGKSSLINKLVNQRRLAKVSNTPGRTQLLNFFTLNDAFVLCDLPGYGYAKVSKSVKANWGRMIETYLAERVPLKALLLLVDIRREPGEWERDLVGYMISHGRAVVPVATKIDKLSKNKRRPALMQLARQLGVSQRRLVGWSAVSGEGMDDLWRSIQRHVAPPPPVEPVTDPS